MKNKTPANCETGAFQQWFDRFTTFTSFMKDPAGALAPPPPGPVAPDALPALLRARAELQVRDADKVVATEAGRRVATAWTGASRGDQYAELAAALVQRLDGLIADLLGAGHADPSIVRTADFGMTCPLIVQAAEITPTGSIGDVKLICGVVGTLPPDHSLLTILDRDEFYRGAGLYESLVLGRADPVGNPRPFYPLAECLAYTRTFRHRQKENERQRAEQDAQEKREADRAFWNSEIGMLKRKQEALERLEKSGKIPAAVIDPPVIRMGRN